MSTVKSKKGEDREEGGEETERGEGGEEKKGREEYSSKVGKESFFFQAEDGIRDLVRSRGLGDVYKGQPLKSRRNAALFGYGQCLLLATHAGMPWLPRC